MKDRIRSFVAIELSGRVKESLQREVARLRQAEADVKWVPPEAMHVTLKFLGDVSRAQLHQVSKAMQAAADKHAGFRLRVGGVAFFPKPVKPRIVSVGVDAESAPPMAALAADIDEHMGELGFGREERAFKAHITLGRVKSQRGVVELGEAIAASTLDALGEQDVDEVVLYMSELARAGPAYTALGRAQLLGT
jgi:2'-5' RNA ligase